MENYTHELPVTSILTALPDDANDPIHGSRLNPVYRGELAKIYQFSLHAFQRISIACLERKEHVVVIAPASAGKSVIANYAIAMAIRDNERVIYVSPLEALSNQIYYELSKEFPDGVGLMTGDVTHSPDASCLVMTIEILRRMLYGRNDVIKEVGWVVFDEIQCMKDRERGVFWEESIMALPDAINMVFLSATLSNATEFSAWILGIRGLCHLVSTDFRPTPLQQYVWPKGGSQLYLVADGNEQFNEDIFFPKAGDASGESDIYNIVKMIKERQFQPVIIFSYSRRECQQHAMAVAELDFNSQEEKDMVDLMFKNAMSYLSEEDRNLPAIQSMLPLLRRGIAIHHYGLLPIIKELVELMFQEDLVKAVFATETSAMGLNIPAKTVVFTNVRKEDGDSYRYVDPCEYIQMSGRAGRRGTDEYGICIIMIDNQMEMNTVNDIMLGKPAPLVSSFRLNYHLILDLMRREDVSIWDPIRRDLGLFTQEEVFAFTFHEFQYQNSMRKLAKLKAEVAKLDASGESQDEKQIQSLKREELNHEIQQLQSIFSELQPRKYFHLENRLKVLKTLGYIDDEDIVQVKGHVACLIDTGDELIVTEWIFDGNLNNLDYHQIAALASCFILGDKSSERIQVTSELATPLRRLQDIARRIAELQHECNVEVDVDEYVVAAVRPFLMDVIYNWSKGSSFSDIMEMTDMDEGSVIEAARTLHIFLNQLQSAIAASSVIADVGLEEKVGAARDSVHRGLMDVPSLYYLNQHV